MRPYSPIAVSNAAILGGGAIGAGIAYLLDHTVPAFGGKARLFDRDFLQPFLLGWAVPPVVLPAHTESACALALRGWQAGWIGSYWLFGLLVVILLVMSRNGQAYERQPDVTSKQIPVR